MALVDTLRTIWNSIRGGGGQNAGVGMFPMGMGNTQTFYSQNWDFIRVINTVYGNPSGFRCVEAIASNLSRPPWLILPGDAPWPQIGGDPVKAQANHPLLTLLNRPNPMTTGTMMQRLIGRDLELAGKSFWMKMPQGRNVRGQFAPELRRLPPQRVTVVGNQDDDLIGFVFMDRSGRQSPILPESMVYLRYPHPERTYDGIAPALMAGLPAETDTAAARYNKELLTNDSGMPGYLMIEGLTPDKFVEWKDRWEKGAMPGKTRFISGNSATYVKVGQTNQELTYKDLREDAQDDILRAFGVPRAVAFDVSHETYANAEREQALFMQQNILPKWVLLADELTLQLGDPAGVRIAFDLAGIDELQDSRDAMVDRMIKLMGMQVETVNEGRKSMGWDPVPWGDEPLAPLQAMSAKPIQPPVPDGEETQPPNSNAKEMQPTESTPPQGAARNGGQGDSK